jgi:hypothetical protein
MILISRSVAAEIFAEIQRWVEGGLREGGTPLESLCYPLSALVPAGELRTPLELVSVADLREVVLDGVAIPPDRIKAYSALNCHFSAADLEAVNQEFNAQIDRQLDRRPRLGVHSKLHSHPFTGGSFLSGGDVMHGATSAAAVKWRQSKGLACAILHVAFPSDHPVPSTGRWKIHDQGAVAQGPRKILWRVRTWAASGDGTMTDLGDARVVSDRHPTVRAARRRPYWQTRSGSRWCDVQKNALRAAGYAVTRNLLGRGWRRYLLRAGGRHLLIALPPDLPATSPRVLEIRNLWANEFEALTLPPSARGASLAGLSLVGLARHYGDPA